MKIFQQTQFNNMYIRKNNTIINTIQMADLWEEERPK